MHEIPPAHLNQYLIANPNDQVNLHLGVQIGCSRKESVFEQTLMPFSRLWCVQLVFVCADVGRLNITVRCAGAIF